MTPTKQSSLLGSLSKGRGSTYAVAKKATPAPTAPGLDARGAQSTQTALADTPGVTPSELQDDRAQTGSTANSLNGSAAAPAAPATRETMAAQETTGMPGTGEEDGSYIPGDDSAEGLSPAVAMSEEELALVRGLIGARGTESIKNFGAETVYISVRMDKKLASFLRSLTVTSGRGPRKPLVRVVREGADQEVPPGIIQASRAILKERHRLYGIVKTQFDIPASTYTSLEADRKAYSTHGNALAVATLLEIRLLTWAYNHPKWPKEQR